MHACRRARSNPVSFRILLTPTKILSTPGFLSVQLGPLALWRTSLGLFWSCLTHFLLASVFYGVLLMTGGLATVRQISSLDIDFSEDV